MKEILRVWFLRILFVLLCALLVWYIDRSYQEGMKIAARGGGGGGGGSNGTKEKTRMNQMMQNQK